MNSNHSKESELLAAVRRGDAHAPAAFWQEYAPGVRCILLRHISAQDVDEALFTTMGKAISGIRTFGALQGQSLTEYLRCIIQSYADSERTSHSTRSSVHAEEIRVLAASQVLNELTTTDREALMAYYNDPQTNHVHLTPPEFGALKESARRRYYQILVEQNDLLQQKTIAATA